MIPIPPIDNLTMIPDGAKCQEASMYSRNMYVPCGARAIAIIDNGDSRPYYMCLGCATHNIGNRSAKVIFSAHSDFLEWVEQRTRRIDNARRRFE